MEGLRTDIAEAETRMRVTFGTRTAIRDLHETLEEGETVVDMVACLFAGGDGLLVLTDRRVIALRDDFSVFRSRSVNLTDVTAVDYAPRIHDGLGVLTADGRIAVRRMQREDSDRVVDGILIRVPEAILGVSRPAPTAETPALEAAPGDSQQPAAQPAAGSNATAPIAGAPASDVPAGAEPSVGPSSPATASRTPVDADREAGAEADAAVLRGVLADLHAKGLLTDDEFAAKVAQLSGRH